MNTYRIYTIENLPPYKVQAEDKLSALDAFLRQHPMPLDEIESIRESSPNYEV